MMLSRQALLITCCISFSLHAMEPETPTTTNNDTDTSIINSDNSNFYPINSIYKKTSSLLNNFNLNDHETIIQLSAIITRTKELKQSNINEQDISLFAFKQKDSFFKKHPYYTTVFFERVAQYNTKLEKDKITSPTPEQFACHKSNQKINATVDLCSTINIFIDTQKLTENNRIINLPTTIATSDFEQLIHDTNAMLSMPLGDIINIATLLHGEKL